MTIVGQNAAMRYLTIVRHAKAAPVQSGANDFDRPLSAKGRAQCEQLRVWVSDPNSLGAYGPTTALASSSARTRETYAVAFAGTPFVHALEVSSLIYNGARHVSAQDLLSELAAIDPGHESLLVVAHNPSVLELVRTLCVEEIPALAKDKFPTSTAVVLRLVENETVGLRSYSFETSFLPEI